MSTPIDKLLSRDGVREFHIWPDPSGYEDNVCEVTVLSEEEKKNVNDNDIHVIDAAHVAKLEAALKKAISALESVQDNPTGDSTGIINHRNTWTNWAKERASETLAEIEKIAGGE